MLWVDAICINQEDREERSRQVQLMAQIHANASCVVVWLEEATTAGGLQEHEEGVGSGDEALQVLCRAANSGRAMGESDSEADKRTVVALFQRSWFRRI